MYTFIILSIIYIAGFVYTYHVCTPENQIQDPLDHLIIPIVTFLWPIIWGWIIIAESIGWTRRKIRITRRRKKFDRK